MVFKGTVQSVFIGFSCLLLAACGGSGGGTTTSVNPAPANPLPVGPTPVASLPFIPINSNQTFDPQLLQVLQVPESAASIELAANALVKSDLSQPVGRVNMSIGSVNPAIQFDILPGELLTKLPDGRVLPIEIYGAVSFAFVDAEGSELDLAPGFSASIRIPVINKSNDPDNSVRLYFYDADQGVWLEQGTAELLGDAATNSQYYEGRVNRFSIWATGNVYSQVNISGCVENIGNTPAISVADVKIISSGVNYSGELQSKSDALGLYSVAVKQNSEVLIYGQLNGVKTNTIKITTDTNDQLLSECLVFTSELGGSDNANASISITTSWGVPNVNLDVRLTGPNNINIFFNILGSLIQSPFIHLDVTDEDGFGPEVMTVFGIDNSGSYQYRVSRFGVGSSVVNDPITNSLAKVELNINGNITVFTPPLGEGDNLIWNVFDFALDSNGDIVVSEVNTWSPSFTN